VHLLKVNAMNPADRPILRLANAHEGLNVDRDGRCVSGPAPVVQRGKAERIGREQCSHNQSPPFFRADP
jgi:hypothetical protein